MQFAGYEHLRRHLGLTSLTPWRTAQVRPVLRMDASAAALAVPARAVPAENDLLAHVLFALKHEGTDLALLAEALPKVSGADLLTALRQRPSGKYLRLAAYLWEAFTGQLLTDLPTLGGATVPVFDPARYYTAEGPRSARWRVAFNGLGDLDWCATVRRRADIEAALASDLLGRANTFAANVEAGMLDRALSWAYLGETRASFEIERETPGADKARTFVELLRHAHEPRVLSEEFLAQLQSATVSNPFDRAAAFRHEQNWLGSGAPGVFGVSYVPPPPELVPDLMRSLMAFANDRARGLDPLIAAGCLSFGFVFIHPFMDGNGRLSRFLFHHALCQSGGLSNGLILPVSIAMARQEREYLAVLQSYSRPVRERWDVRLLDVDRFDMRFEASPAIYRYWDATDCVAFGLGMAEAALSEDLLGQVAFARRYDRVVQEIGARFDIRNAILSTLVVSALQQGRVSQRRRDQFALAVPAEAFDAIEAAVQCPGEPAEGDAPERES